MNRRVLFYLWLIFTVAWAAVAWNITPATQAVSTYSVYYSYIRDIQNGVANNYERASYMGYMPQLQQGGIQFGEFLIVALSLPVLLWLGGKRFLPPPAKKKKPKK